ncbi:hypothetical protein GCM10011504_37800 [Siccirubricoccus deserti]|nr:hypothetical protein GCM10011504_37800 [Siccirubricoccus deserti]
MLVRVAEGARWSQPRPLGTVGGAFPRAAKREVRYDGAAKASAGRNSSLLIHSESAVVCLVQ